MTFDCTLFPEVTVWARRNKKLLASVRAGETPSSNQDNPVGFWNAFDIAVKGNHISGIALILLVLVLKPW